MKKYDVIIVGGGPAGSATARYTAHSGLSTLVIDRRKEIGIPVHCGEYLPTTNEMLSIFPKIKNYVELFQIKEELISKRSKIVRIISPWKKEYQFEFDGFSVNRDAFDKWLIELSLNANAELLIDTRVKNLKNNIVNTDKGSFHAKIIVGADGPYSTVAREFGFQQPTDIAPSIACQVKGEFESVVEMHFGKLAPGGFAWIIPKEGGANVGLGVQRRVCKTPLTKLLAKFLELRGLRTEEMNIGFVPISGPISQTVKGQVLLVGSAAGQVMATNGGGIPLAMICGRIAGESIVKHINEIESLEEYEIKWRNLVGEPLEVGARTKKLADLVFPYNFFLELAMKFLGVKRLERAAKCKPLFFDQ